MEISWILLSGALALTALVLLLRLLSLRHALREIADELDEKLHTDTNTLISLSAGDRTARALAARLNGQLCALRAERLRLQQGDAALRTDIANVCHDLRTPLTAVCGYLDLLAREEHTAQAERYLAILRERTGALRSLTEEMLRYTIASSTAEQLKREPVCLNDVLHESLAGLYAVLTGRGVEPTVDLPQERVVRELDRAALRRVLDNILNNAARYSDGDLAICLTASGEMTFENGAKGLDRVQTERLFDRFFTVQSAGGSTGLGLSIARLLTERMGGQIAADYRAGRLCVRVRLPGR